MNRSAHSWRILHLLLYCDERETVERGRPRGQPAISQSKVEIVPTRDAIVRISWGVALAAGSLSLAGAGAVTIGALRSGAQTGQEFPADSGCFLEEIHFYSGALSSD
jgi:hypothetical protein